MAKDVTSGNKTFADACPDTEDRPWEKRGFYVIAPVTNYPSLGKSELLNKEFEVKDEFDTHPFRELPPRQKQWPDSPSKGKKAKA